MTTQQAPEAKAAVVQDAQELAERAVADTPEVRPHRQAVTLVLGLYVQYVNPLSGQSKPLEEALTDLEAFQDLYVPDVMKAITIINGVVQAKSVGVAEEFEKLTGTPLDPKTLDTNPRTMNEMAEQDKLDGLAGENLDKVAMVVNRLRVRDLYAINHPQAVTPSPSPRETILQGWTRKIEQAAIDRGLKKVETAESAEKPFEPEPDWLTPPILDPQNRQYAMLIKRLDRVVTQIQENKDLPNMREVVLGKLANLNLSQEALEQMLETVSELSRRQEEQSRRVKQHVNDDVERLSRTIKALNDLKAVYGAVLRYFEPALKAK